MRWGWALPPAGRFFSGNQTLFARISGIIMILFGVYQFGFFGKASALETEHRLPFRLDKWAMNPLVALVLGFTFSFAWTPCVGPHPGQRTADGLLRRQRGQGLPADRRLYRRLCHPLLAVGIFTGTVLNFFKTHQKVVKYTGKVGAALLVLMGIMTFTGFMNGITGYLSGIGGGTSVAETPTRAKASRPRRRAPSARNLRRAPLRSPPPSLLPSQRIAAPRLHPHRPVRQHPYPVGLPGQDGVSQLLGHLVRPL